MKTYITSDLHFFHKNILRFQSNRKFSSIEEMNESIINEWNSKVSNEDTVYHLGDFAFCTKDSNIKNILSRLNGNKIFILGNHDKEDTLSPHGKVYSYLEIKHNYLGVDHLICLFHFPIVHWHHQEKGSLHFYGHVHGSFDNPGRSLDVGYDKHNKIILLDEVIEMVRDKEIINRFRIIPNYNSYKSYNKNLNLNFSDYDINFFLKMGKVINFFNEKKITKATFNNSIKVLNFLKNKNFSIDFVNITEDDGISIECIGEVKTLDFEILQEKIDMTLIYSEENKYFIKELDFTRYAI